ncbi:olfactory receptor 2D3-like isoform X2 [Bos indicus x Bos taurus]|uniref:Olfactory receptor 2D2-like n=1 Tax=Bos indicus x Bos taurus TaxID=30522 RepID=A0A4W2FA46_BOBOX|nr:olfactory receptor 2D3-like isoform X2 [Bos indicus x Bos taurus]XP_027393368.1 olfactory receptor 2D3-like isoform X2 [Bos indicus x Bos taurus]XP_027393369.1 olfactory receptor 2D3-like isoform X2 [Bos indicus x Bos taurus]
MAKVKIQNYIEPFVSPPVLQKVFYLLILVSNSLLITLIHQDTRLHTPMYFFISVLSMLDMCYTTTTVPQMLAHILSKKRAISFARCVAQMYIFLLFGIIEYCLFSIMSVDRYVAICHPLRYKVIMSPWVCLLMVGICAAYGVLDGLSYTFFAMCLPYCGPNETDHYFCEVPAVLKLACADISLNDLVNIITGFSVIVVPLSLIVLVYVNIFATIMKIRSAQGRIKAFSTCTSHITVVTMFAIPCIIMYMSPGSDSLSNNGKKMALFYNVATAFLNPVIYSLRNKDVNRAFLKLVGRGRAPE